jgi:hypothetical protein
LDIYHIWCDLKPGVRDLDFVEAVEAYCSALRDRDALAAYRITRRKLGLAHPSLGEFHVMLEFNGLAQLDEAFKQAAGRANPVESFHHAVNSKVTNFMASLYRDFPDDVRTVGQERF